VIRREAPTSAAVEAPFHGKSSRAALQLAHARGVVLAVLAEAGLEIGEYSPATVKQSVAGNGRADKLQVRRMIGCLLGPAAAKGPDDLTDALAVAWCHVARGAGRRGSRAPRRIRWRRAVGGADRPVRRGPRSGGTAGGPPIARRARAGMIGRLTGNVVECAPIA